MAPPPKCYISTSDGALERIILTHTFNHTIDLLLPSECYSLIADRLHAALKPLSYRRLVMPLGAILEPVFFDTFIKTGNVLLLSHGRIDVDNVFSLSDGVLRMSLSKNAYEKAGIVGRPSKFGAGPSLKRQRWLVELNLRSPAYLTNSKSFKRLLSACERVFSTPQVFLFADLANTPLLASIPAFDAAPQRPIHPLPITAVAVTELQIPRTFAAPAGARAHGGAGSYSNEVWREWACELHEWIALASLPADRLLVGARGEVDSLLSTYTVEDARAGRVVRVRWSGLIPAKWAWDLFCQLKTLLLQENDEKHEYWAALTVHGFENAVVSWGDKLHGALGGGENAVTVLSVPAELATAAGEQVVAGERSTMVFELVGGQDEYS